MLHSLVTQALPAQATPSDQGVQLKWDELGDLHWYLAHPLHTHTRCSHLYHPRFGCCNSPVTPSLGLAGGEGLAACVINMWHWEGVGLITHFIQDTTKVIPDIYENILIIIWNIEKYFTESCSEGVINQLFFLNLFIKSLADFIETSSLFDEQIQENMTWCEMG